MNPNEEIILSSLCDRIMAFCNILNKILDMMDEREQPGYQHYSLHQPLTAAYGQPPYASFDSRANNTGWPLPPTAPAQMLEPYHHYPSLTPEPNIPYSHYQPSEELYPPVYNGEGYSINSFNYSVDDYLPYTDSWQPGPSCWDPPTPAFEKLPYNYTESYALLRIPYAGDHREQPDCQPRSCSIRTQNHTCSREIPPLDIIRGDQNIALHGSSPPTPRPPNITCTKNYLVDNLWSRCGISCNSSIDLQKDCHVTTVIPSSRGDTSPSDDGIIVVADAAIPPPFQPRSPSYWCSLSATDKKNNWEVVPSTNNGDVASINHQSFALDADAHKGNMDDLTPEVHDSNKNVGIEGTDSCDAKRERSFELENTKDNNDLMKKNSVDDVNRSKYGDGIMYSNRERKLIIVGVDISHPIDLPKDATFEPKQRTWLFDPGGDSSPKLLFATLFVMLWFPP